MANFRPKKAEDLLARVRDVSRRLIEAQPFELVIGNICRRILGLIRDGQEGSKQSTVIVNDSIEHINGTSSKDGPSQTEPDAQSSVKEDVLDGIRELLDELDQADKQIAEYSIEHLLPEETVLIFGGSRTVQRFLLDAAKKRKFRVFVVEGYPNEHRAVHEAVTSGAIRDINEPSNNQNRLKSLTSASIQVTIIPDTQVFAVMPVVSKVILSAQGMFSNGSCVTSCGQKGIATAARHHHVPVLILGAMYRLSPTCPYDPRTLVEQGDPSASASYQDGKFLEDVQTPHYLRDYLSSEFVSLFVTNM